MSFRKRSIGIQRSPIVSSPAGGHVETDNAPTPTASGIRPSPLTGQPTTSTGAYSLDSLLGGHAGLALGSSLLVEESGTTDFAGALLRYYAAEGIIQSHTVHLVGAGEQWIKDLPGLVGDAEAAEAQKQAKSDEKKMKIAWRYERLGQVDADRGSRVVPQRGPAPVQPSEQQDEQQSLAFCHNFDLAKRLAVPAEADINHIAISPQSPLSAILQHVSQRLSTSKPHTIHRLVIPSLLSPALYPPSAGAPENLLQFLHSLRSLLRQYPSRLTAMITLPLELYHRSTALVRWAETLSDGVLELTPFPHLMDAANSLAESGGARATDEQPQGMLKLHKLPVTTERGGGGAAAGVGDDLAFTVSRRRFVIKPFSLPPAEGDTEAQQGNAEGGALGKATKVDIEF